MTSVIDHNSILIFKLLIRFNLKSLRNVFFLDRYIKL